MNQLIYEIAGKKYLLMDVLMTESNSDDIEKMIKKYDGISRGVKELKRGGFFTNPYAIIEVLIPEDKALEFSNEDVL